MPPSPTDTVRALERELYALAQHRKNAGEYQKSLATIAEQLARVHDMAKDENTAQNLQDAFKEKKIFALMGRTIAEYRHTQTELQKIDTDIQAAEAFLDSFRFYRNYGFRNIKEMEAFAKNALQKLNNPTTLFIPAYLGKIDLAQLAASVDGKVVPAKGVEFNTEKFDGIIPYLDERKSGSGARFLGKTLKIVRTSATGLYCETDNSNLATLDQTARDHNGHTEDD